MGKIYCRLERDSERERVQREGGGGGGTKKERARENTRVTTSSERARENKSYHKLTHVYIQPLDDTMISL